MNVWEARVVVRERGLAEIVDLAVRFTLVLGGGLYARLAAGLLLPSFALCFWLLHQGIDAVLVWALALCAFSLLQLPFTVAAGRLLFSADVSSREVLQSALRLAFTTCRARMLGLALFAVAGVTVVGAPFAISRALYLGEVVVLEGAGAVSAYRRTSRLTARHVGKAFLVWLATLAVSLACVFVAQVVARALAAEGLTIDALPEVWQDFSAPAAIAGLFLSVPLVATLRFLAYIDIRTRREGWDIQVRFLELSRLLHTGAI